MIISKDINPERDYYYLGAKVIEILSTIKDKKVDFLDVYNKLNTTEDVSIKLYTYTLDWLYLIGAINQSEKEGIVKCF
ncbi:MAG: ABC-three component system middle component 6 [Marinifilaceae bacterium]